MKSNTTIFIVTPSYNSDKTLSRTIASVVSQSGDFEINYHVQDGGSQDGTVSLLKRWKDLIETKAYPISCNKINFSFSSEPDDGMYDAIVHAFSIYNIAHADWMGWINSDDFLMPGAFSYLHEIDSGKLADTVNWITSSVASVAKDGFVFVQANRPISTYLVREGLCDGIHWDYIQQEGTFFRNSIWRKLDLKNDFLRFKLAGDWNLWRRMAHYDKVYQSAHSLGVFNITPGQLSQTSKAIYQEEINTLIPEEERLKRLRKVVNNGAECQNVYTNWSDSTPRLKSINITQKVAERLNLIDKNIAHLNINQTIERYGSIVVFDAEWQYPAITEQHAFKKMFECMVNIDGVFYLAFPWATLIDNLHNKKQHAQFLLDVLSKINKITKYSGSRIVTTCQHILMLKYHEIFVNTGVTDIFWTHAVKGQESVASLPGVKIHPFPLFPVQAIDCDYENAIDRDLLYSFVGAKSNKWYLTQSRSFIIDLLNEDKRGLVIGRDKWHYEKIVYDCQINKKLLAGGDEIDKSSSREFQTILKRSIFSLCPSGSGPNSIRLWESISFGSIPVILADNYLPPGNLALWNEAAVFCEETEAAIKSLPNRLEAIAKDPVLLERKRQAMRQLWMMYGTDCFVYDILKLLFQSINASKDLNNLDTKQNIPRFTSLPSVTTINSSLVEDKAKVENKTVSVVNTNQTCAVSFLEQMISSFSPKRTLTQQEAHTFLRCCSSELLKQGGKFIESLEGDLPIGRHVQMCESILSENDSVALHFKRVLAHYKQQARHSGFEYTAKESNNKIKICLFGRHSNRTPLSYAPFKRLLSKSVTFVEDPKISDVVMTGFNLDIRENAKIFEEIAREHPHIRVMVISEEPLWDSTWSGGFLERNRIATCGDFELSYTYLNHSNSSIFDFLKIPYFLLTQDEYLIRYSLLIARHLNISPNNLLAHWSKAPVAAAFYSEVREGDAYSSSFREHAVYGLSSYRTEVAKKTDIKGAIRVGKGWHSEMRRQDLPDWHLDKLAALDKQVKVISSYENTHQRSYISEKIFDAFVVCGIPTYYADPQHRIFDLVPEECMINTYDQSAETAANRIETISPNLSFAESWLETANQLKLSFSDVDAIAHERRRVINAIMAEVYKVVG